MGARIVAAIAERQIGQPIVVVNKIDRQDARPAEVVDEILVSQQDREAADLRRLAAERPSPTLTPPRAVIDHTRLSAALLAFDTAAIDQECARLAAEVFEVL